MATIRVIVTKNPKREGTAAHDMFARYTDGMTEDGYIRVIRDTAAERVRMGLPGRANQGRPAILWDLEREFIRLE